MRYFARLLFTSALLLGLAASGRAQAQTFSASQPTTILADGQFVYGPNVGDFDLAVYLGMAASPLQNQVQVIDDKAQYYSINPQVLLAILEMRSGLVSGKNVLATIDNPLGYPDVTGFAEQAEMLAQALFIGFYSRLYDDTQLSGTNIELQLSTGEIVTIPADLNAGSYALLTTLAPLCTPQQWAELISPENSKGFTQSYRRLFPLSDPLDTSNQILAPSAPPAGLLKLPFGAGDRWNFSGGPHGNDGTCANAVSAVDFAPGVSNCTIPTTRWVDAVASGTVSSVSCGGCLVRITHSDNWGSYYYHLANTAVSSGQSVSKGQNLGNPSQKPYCSGSCGTCSGNATGVHIHYSLMYNGAYVDIEGASLEGWIVHGTSCYSGYLERDGTQVWKGSWVTSDGTAPTTTSSIAGTPGENGWYVSNVDISLSTADNSGGSGVEVLQYKLDEGEWQSVSGSTVNVAITGDGVHTLLYKAKDNAWNLESEKRLLIKIDTLAPEGSMTIEEGATLTYLALVNLDTPGSDATSGIASARFRDAGMEWSDWEDYSGRFLWLLNGSHAQALGVEAQFKDLAGNLSGIYSDDIFLNIYPGQPASSNYELERTTFGSSGMSTVSPNYVMNGTAGQPSMVGVMQSSMYIIQSGYWARLSVPTTNCIYLPIITNK